MKTLYVSDLDGTLLGKEHRLSAYALETLNRLVREGMPFTYATARSPNSSAVVTKGLKVRLPVVVYNGVSIFESGTGKVLSEITFPQEITTAVCAELSRFSAPPMVFSQIAGEPKLSWLTGAENEGMQYFIDNRKGDPRLRPVSDEKSLFEGKVFYYTCIGKKEDMVPVYEAVSKLPGCRVILQQEIYRPEYWLEIMPEQATKANAVLRLKELLGCERVVSFGDAVNDIPLFEVSDACYAVENAVPELKEVATGVIGPNTEDGVVRWLDEYAAF